MVIVKLSCQLEKQFFYELRNDVGGSVSKIRIKQSSRAVDVAQLVQKYLRLLEDKDNLEPFIAKF